MRPLANSLQQQLVDFVAESAIVTKVEIAVQSQPAEVSHGTVQPSMVNSSTQPLSHLVLWPPKDHYANSIWIGSAISEQLTVITNKEFML